VLADGHLLFLSEKGQLQVAKASPEGYNALATAPVLSGRCWTVPTLQEGRLYLRDFKNIVCLDMRK
jgi:hypothetical protein